nr:hypothetical protein [Klebsiella pneumoniae]
MHFPADVLAGWTLGWSCTALAGWLLPLAAPVWQSARRTSAWVWFTAASAVMISSRSSPSSARLPTVSKSKSPRFSTSFMS